MKDYRPLALMILIIFGVYVGYENFSGTRLRFIKNRLPANVEAALTEAKKDLFWQEAQLEYWNDSEVLYALRANFPQIENKDLCSFTRSNDFNTSVVLSARGMAISGEVPHLKVKTSCDKFAAGFALFMQDFCKASLRELRDYVSPDAQIEYKFENLLDGRPQEWFIKKIQIDKSSGESIELVPTEEQKKFKYTVSCPST